MTAVCASRTDPNCGAPGRRALRPHSRLIDAFQKEGTDVEERKTEQGHLHTPCNPRRGRWHRFWELVRNTEVYDKKTLISTCTVCGKLIEPAVDMRSCRILCFLLSYVIAFSVAALIKGMAEYAFIMLGVLAVLIALNVLLEPLILTFVPWRTLPADEREYMKNKEHDLRVDKTVGTILLCLFAAVFLLWEFLL